MAVKPTVIRLRKDTEAAFTAANTVLKDGEVAIVETSLDGLRLKIGRGLTSNFNDIPYETFGLLAKGRLLADNQFRREDQITVVSNPEEYILFVDTYTKKLYYWDIEGRKYVAISGDTTDVPYASSTVPGIAKLYDTLNGTNTDGSVTQRATNEGFAKVQTAANAVEQKIEDETYEIKISSLTNLVVLD